MTTSKPSAIPEERISSKLLKRLNAFTRITSKESTQTLAKWVLFHARHHESPLQNTLLSFLLETPVPSTPAAAAEIRILNPVFWNLLNEICTMYSPDGVVDKKEVENRWMTYSDFRLGVGEHILLPAIKALTAMDEKSEKKQVKTLVETMIESWDTKNSFGNTACIEDLREAMDASTDENVQEDSKQKDDPEISVDAMPIEASMGDSSDEAKETSEQVSTPVPSDNEDFGGFGGDEADEPNEPNEPKEINVTPQPSKVQKALTPETDTKKRKKTPSKSPVTSSRKRPAVNKTNSFSTVKIDFESKVSTRTLLTFTLDSQNVTLINEILLVYT